MSVTVKTIPLPLQTLYAELVQQVHGVLERPASLYRRDIKGIEYVYAKRPVGSTRRDLFIGKADDPQAAERIGLIEEENRAAKVRSRLVSTLRHAGIPSPPTALSQVLDSLEEAGLLRQAVVVGTAAYQCYSAPVGHALPVSAMMTQDADLATASLAISAVDAGETLETILKRADPSFRPLPGLDRAAPPSHFRSAAGFVVDLLTPQYRRTDPNPVLLPALAAGAAPLQHLSWLITAPMDAAVLYRSGIAVRIPQPARFAVHKLVIAQKPGGDTAKRAKDLVQARALIHALKAADPFALSDACEDACAQGVTGWKRPIERSLRELGLTLDDLCA
ncbi:GSU2403 family nucleotidyltransferase fold protein [Xanthobacter sp.]|uniref:GSU2403 family nucleotidyltransferase fold protein n=1 Tax=Xanthobacter sp. TaxID=35809 RepID=UPI0025F2CBF8|nr:GSU2403 family nucleotidyltransferase fold protein [Xanthobacter sp.]